MTLLTSWSETELVRGQSGQNAIEPVAPDSRAVASEADYLAPADARAAFARESIDAWFIWDPYYAEAQRSLGARVLSTAEPFVRSASFFLAAREFVSENREVVRTLLDELRDTSHWVSANREAASVLVSKASGIDRDVLKTAFVRAQFDVVPLSSEIVARQQIVANQFARLGIIPQPISVAAAVPRLDWK